MRFLHKQYQAKKKEIIEVEIDRPAKVKYMTAFDFKNYKLGRSHKYYGGTFDESPVRFVVPFDANWNVVVERGTHYAPLDVQAQCRLLLPDRSVYTSVALDAPEHVKRAAALESGDAVSEPMNEDEGRSMS